MAKQQEQPSTSLTIYVIKKVVKPEEVVLTSGKVSQRTLEINADIHADLFIQTQPRKRPSWARFFEGFIQDSDFGWVSSSSAVLLVTLDDRLFALTFGYGRHLLSSRVLGGAIRLGRCSEFNSRRRSAQHRQEDLR